MNGSTNFFKKFRLCLLFFSIQIQSQLYNDQLNSELSSHFFGLEYFTASWQASIFEEDFYLPHLAKQKIEFSKLSNSLRLNYTGAEKMLTQHKEKFPNSSLNDNIDLEIANYYFKNEKYRYALKWFNGISEESVLKLDRPEFNFNKGYSLFSAKKYKDARPFFEKVKDDKKYQSDSHYYLGHIAYQLEDFDSALTSFGRISDPTKKEDLTYFQADMNFRLGRFNQAIDLAKRALENANKDEKSELSKIIGESYFNLKLYSEAIPYLESYKGKKGKISNTDLYQLGYAYFKEKKFTKAISQFNQIIGENNSLSQNSYYTLAECYLKTNNKSAALNAFKIASKMSFNPNITEDAFLNYAKLSYEIGNPFESPPKVIVNFLKLYPKNENQGLLRELLISSYTRAGNFSAAIEILENDNGFKNNKTFQKVLILNAVNKYKNASYSEANELLKRSLKLKENKNLDAYALYWLGRSEYELNEFDKALDTFKQFKRNPKKETVPSFKRLNYDMAYIYFKLKEYDYALQYFKNFDSDNSSFDPSYQRDTYLRIGDCHFALKQYWPAMENYNTSIALNQKLGAYPNFQKAISYGFVDRNFKKISTLEKLIKDFPNDDLIDDALFELALVYSEEKQEEKSISTYDQLIESHKISPYIGKAALNKGLILYNQEKYELAVRVLEDVALSFKKYEIGQQAIITLKEIAIDQGKVKDFNNWIKNNNLNQFSDIELEKIQFISAEKQFLDGNKNNALKLFEEYLEIYPKGAYVRGASYYLAELNFENGLNDRALFFYKTLIEDKVSTYTEKALVRIINILKNDSKESEAIFYMERLSNIASFKQNKRFAKLNLMRAYFAAEEYQKSLEASNNVLNLSDLENSIKWDALTIKARSSLFLKDSVGASNIYFILEKSPDELVVAEALYFRANLLNIEGKYDLSNDVISQISISTNQSSVWNAKSLLLLAKNYYLLNDPFQAIFVLDSLIENFKTYDQIVSEAQLLKTKFEDLLKNKNQNDDA